MISVFIVAASPLARFGLENLLLARQIEIAGSASHLDDLDHRLDDAPADVILVDATGEPLELFLGSLVASGLASDFSVVVLVEPASLSASSAALRDGVRAFLPNDVSADQLVAALQAAASGLVVLHPRRPQRKLLSTEMGSPQLLLVHATSANLRSRSLRARAKSCKCLRADLATRKSLRNLPSPTTP